MPKGASRKQVLTIIALAILILIVGVMVGRSMALQELAKTAEVTKTAPPKATSEEPTDLEAQTFVAPSEPVTIPESVMTERQQKARQFVGVDTKEIVITPEMFACAEASIGSQRMIDIQNGDTPSVVEGAKLLTCYNQ